MTLPLIRAALTLVAVLMPLCSLLLAQDGTTSAVVTVEVMDESGAPLTNAQAKVVSIERADARSMATDATGRTLLELKPGNYDLTVTMPGFRTLTRRITVSAGESRKFNIVLKVGSCPPGPCVVVSNPPLQPTTALASAAESNVVGIWRGDSICVQKNTSCHDEDAVYRISAIPGKQGHVYVSGGKMVDGKEVVMGSGEWRFDANTRTLSSELPLGEIVLVVDGDKMQGTFTLHDKTVFRHITLKRERH